MYPLLIGFLLLLPFQYVVVLPGGIEAVRLYAALLGLTWLAGYLLDPRNRGRIGSLAPWLLGGMVAATALAVPFAIDPAASAVRWGRFVVLWVGFAVAMPATLGTTSSWRRVAFVYVIAGVVFGLLNYSNYLLAPVGLLREIAESDALCRSQRVRLRGGRRR